MLMSDGPIHSQGHPIHRHPNAYSPYPRSSYSASGAPVKRESPDGASRSSSAPWPLTSAPHNNTSPSTWSMPTSSASASSFTAPPTVAPSPTSSSSSASMNLAGGLINPAQMLDTSPIAYPLGTGLGTAPWSREDAAQRDRTIRRRSSKACDQCRKSKCKCERPVPSTGAPDEGCKNCIMLGVPCTFLGPSRKRGPPKGYIDALEARMHQAEAVIGVLMMAEANGSERGRNDSSVADAMRRVKQDELGRVVLQRVNEGPYGAVGRVQGAVVPVSAKRAAQNREREGTVTVDGYDDDVPLEQRHPTQEWQDSLIHQYPRAMSHGSSSRNRSADTRSVWVSPRQDSQRRLYGSSSGFIGFEKLGSVELDLVEPAPAALALPHRSPSDLTTMLDTYMHRVHTILPIVDQAEAALSSFSESSLGLAMVACVSPSSDVPTYTGHALALLSYSSSITSVHTLLHLSYASLPINPGYAWLLAGQACRQAIELGFHKVGSSAEPSAATRMWSACTLMDALSAGASGRATLSEDAAVSQSASNGDNHNVATALGELGSILATALAGPSCAAQAKQDLLTWRSALSPSLRMPGVDRDSRTADETQYDDDAVNALWMLFWTVLELASPTSPEGRLQSARAVHHLLSTFTPSASAAWVPWCLFRMGRVWRTAIQRHPEDLEAENGLHAITKALRAMSLHGVGARYAELLETELVDDVTSAGRAMDFRPFASFESGTAMTLPLPLGPAPARANAINGYSAAQIPSLDPHAIPSMSNPYPSSAAASLRLNIPQLNGPGRFNNATNTSAYDRRPSMSDHEMVSMRPSSSMSGLSRKRGIDLALTPNGNVNTAAWAQSVSSNNTPVSTSHLHGVRSANMTSSANEYSDMAWYNAGGYDQQLQAQQDAAGAGAAYQSDGTYWAAYGPGSYGANNNQYSNANGQEGQFQAAPGQGGSYQNGSYSYQ